MAIPINSMLALTIALLTKTDLTVTDSGGVGRTVTIGTNAVTTYWRIVLASSDTPGTPSTTASAPKNILAHIETQLNAALGGTLWHVGINTAGFVTFRWSGAGNASIVFPDTILQSVLGYIANVTCNSGNSYTSTSAYHPTHVAYFVSREGDTGWQDDGPLYAGAEPRGATPYGWSDASANKYRTFDAKWHPDSWSTRTDIGLSATDGSATPYQGDSSRRRTRSNTAGVTPPWGMDDTFSAAALNGSTPGMAICGALLGTFQAVFLGSVSTYTTVTVSRETLTKSRAQQPGADDWLVYQAWTGVTLRYEATESF